MVSKKKRMRTGHEDCNGPSSTIDEPEYGESSSCTSIVSISDKELLSIFSLLPLRDLQSLELVSHHFRWIALKVYSDRRCLSLIQTAQYRGQLEDITRYWYFTDYSTRHPFGDDCYHVTRQINSSAVQWFGKRFPNVIQLVLFCVDHLSIERFVQLVQLYPTLERLILYSTDAQQIEYNQPQFWNALYSLRTSLSHLHLPFEHQLTSALLSPLMTSTLRSIHHKTVVNPWEMFDENVPYNLNQYGMLIQSLRRSYKTLLLWKVDSSPPQVAGYHCALPRYGLYLTMEGETPATCRAATNFMLRHGLDYMDSLTTLDLAIPSNIGVLSILPALSQLTRLTHIRLTDRKTIQQQSLFFSQLNKQNYRTKLGEPNRTQLSSVRQLNISQFSISPSTGIFLYLPVIFPQIDTLCLEDCSMIINSTGKIRVNSFPIWLLSSVQRFAHLNRLYHNQRLVLRMDRDKDGDKAERDRLVRVIVEQVLAKSRI